MSSTGASGSIERAFDVLLGLSLAGWSIHHLIAAPQIGVVRATLAALNIAVAALILLRRSEAARASPAQIATALPSVAVGGLIVLATTPERWPVPPMVLLVIACAFTLVSFGFLGRSFAVLPSFRGVVTRGPYAIVRHPAYAGELVMIAAASWAADRPILYGLVPISIILVAARIRAEEELLSTIEAYAAYRARVRYRLIPGVW